MKFVVKSQTPQILLEWIQSWLQEDGSYHGSCHYDELTSKERTPIQKSLMEEQGYICCYTGHEINETTSHIEHLVPRSESKKAGRLLETLDYNNIIAAYPRSPEKSCQYGAHIRGSQTICITPLMSDCETRFEFLPSGIIKEEIDDDVDCTIHALKLNDGILVDIRKAVIEQAIYEPLEYLDPAKAIGFINQLIIAMDERDPENKLKPFCFVIKQVALSLVS